MNTAVGIMDFIGFLAFAGAFATLLRTTLEAKADLAGRAAGYCLLGAFAVYVVAMGSNVLEHLDITAALDPIEDYLEILFPPLVLYSQFSRLMMIKGRAERASQRAAQASQEMLMAILDSTPAGILLLDNEGRVSFANAAAKEVLDITEDDVGRLEAPGWHVRVSGCEARPDFFDVLAAASDRQDVPVDIEWPNGWRISLSIQTETMGRAGEKPGGLVAAFLPPPIHVATGSAVR